MARLNAAQLESLFCIPRTVNYFTDQPVTDEVLREIHRLTFMGPTEFNGQPLRITWLKTPAARQRLAQYLIEANTAKTLAAPMTAILAFEKKWHQHFQDFSPRKAQQAQPYYEPEQKHLPTGLRSATLQAGYFITVVRALGLDVGPLGADYEGLERDELFAGTGQRPFLAVNIGYGIMPEYPRNMRFDFERVTRIL